jgi:3-phosphoglycerate kinase
MRSIINEKNLNSKKILLRLDLNVPLEKDKITDTTRIDKILPTLNFLIKEKAKIIILSHVGRPKGKIVKDLSLKPICEELQNKLKKKVKLISENIKDIKSKNFFSNYNEDIFILENIRFYSEEEQNDNKFAKLISNLGDIYVNDAFSCSHRAHASIYEIPNSCLLFLVYS